MDPQLIAVDQLFPTMTFEGRGSLLRGEGWDRPEGEGRAENWGRFSWVLDGRAIAYFERPPVVHLDFFARCSPYSWYPNAPVQRMTIRLGGAEVRSAVMQPGWQDVRVPLPPRALRPGLNALELRFDHATRPSEVSASSDSRRLSAVCNTVAVVPSALSDPRAYLAAATFLPEDREARLPIGARLTAPLPEGSEVRVHLGGVETGCGRCELEIALLGRDGDRSRVLATLPARDAAGRRWAFRTPRGKITRLGLRLLVAGGEIFDTASAARLELPEDFVLARHPPPGSSAEERRPDVFLYLVDTLRADALGVYGARRPNSARLDSFARDAVTFLRAWSPSAWTLPSVVSILTGVYPYRHGAMKGAGANAVSEGQLPSLGERVAELGYQTVGISQSWVASPPFGIDTGFGRFFVDDHLNSRSLRSQSVRRYLLAWLLAEAEEGAPLFAYLHTVDPHAPYHPVGAFRRYADQTPGTLPPEKYRPALFLSEDLGSDPRDVEHLRALYDGEVRYTDREFGGFLDMLRFLGLYDRSLIVFTSDHGEEFGEHGGFDHGRTVFEEMLRVPLLVKYPYSRGGGTRSEARVSGIDIAPTVLALLGRDGADAQLDGRPLPLDTLGKAASKRTVFAEVSPMAGKHVGAVDYQSLVSDELKCIRSATGRDQFGRPIPRWQAFDLASDPGETRALRAGDPRTGQCAELMEPWLDARRALRWIPGGESPRTGSGVEERLRALGYIR